MSRPDVAVVGAGLAGLVAARRLEAAGRRVAVFEARPEVGGRTRSRLVGGEVVDLGGEMLGTYYRRTFQLTAALGLHTEPTRALRAPILWRDADGRQQLARVLRVDVPDLLGGLSVFAHLERAARGMDVLAPWAVDGARRLDKWPYGEWLRARGVDGTAYRAAEAYIGALASASLDELSLLQIVWWVRKAGGVLQALHSGIQFRVGEGAQEISKRIARELRGPVITESPVTAVERDADRVVLSQADGSSHCVADAAIIAVPLNQVKRIDFRPGLDEPLAAMHHELGFGRIIKAVGVADHRLPARHRLVVGGRSVSLAWTRGARVAEGLIVGAAVDQSNEAILADLGDAFGVTSWSDAVVTRWHEEPFISGSYLVARPGDLTRHGPQLRAAQGRVFFAGNERSSAPCTLEGAVESGIHAAESALALI